ncbi:GNAT family N-acetyltransferase [Nocardia africana]|uniref:Protease synthase and sporulation negative regulatory protein PAI 1 n=1 Tax=Nocardia africana TaxID=134964 RepID=A0A378X006_9NOCA|nr:GNAT family N-acetyltransferase [Nocardia africana]MCC3312235.1 GNAT family N-acetyltransferase [Nocardia africana]SUA46462.1 Protease synthase and sporulation negative regulatory protein PAI 1 [Nocardia africana]
MTEQEVVVDRAGLWDAEKLSDVATATFPLACPPELTEESIAAFIAEVLSGERFGEYLSDPQRVVLKAVIGGDIVGYTMLIAGEPVDPMVATMIEARPALEISKMYVIPGYHGRGVSTALMDAAVDYARRGGFSVIWLGVNQRNERAQRFYGKHGFRRVGTKTFTVGSQVCHDFVMQREP